MADTNISDSTSEAGIVDSGTSTSTIGIVEGTTTGNVTSTHIAAPNLAAQAQGVLKRNDGEAIAAIAELLADNKTQRDNLRAREARIQELQAQLPGEGKAVVEAKDADLLGAYREIGKPDDLKAVTQELPQLRDALATAQRDLMIERYSRDREGRALYVPTVLRTVLQGEALQEAKTEKGETTLAVVRQQEGSEEQQLIPLTDFLQSEKSEFLAALVVQSGNVGSGTRPTVSDKKLDFREADQNVVNKALAELGIPPTRY